MVWQGVQHLTNYRTNLGAAKGDTSLAEQRNLFFAHFEAEQPDATTLHPAAHGSLTLTVEEREVRSTLRNVNPRRAAGPDGVSGRVLKDCTDQVAGVLTRIFNQSLSQSTVLPLPVIKTAQVVNCPLPTLEELHSSRCLKKAKNIIKDISHTEHPLFELLLSGRWYRIIKTKTNRLKNIFYI